MYPDKEFLLRLIQTKMPFGKYAGRPLLDIPEHYLLWLRNKGFPAGELGNMLATLYEIKVNGLEHLLEALR